MKDFKDVAIRLLRENGIYSTGVVGKDLLRYAIAEKIEHESSYQKCIEVARQNIPGNFNYARVTGRGEDLEMDVSGLSEEECQIAIVLESEVHHLNIYDEKGSVRQAREVIKEYIEDMYDKYLSESFYHLLTEKVKELGLDRNKLGTNCLLSAAHYIKKDKEIGPDELYQKLSKTIPENRKKEYFEEVEQKCLYKGYTSVDKYSESQLMKQLIDYEVSEAISNSELKGSSIYEAANQLIRMIK